MGIRASHRFVSYPRRFLSGQEAAAVSGARMARILFPYMRHVDLDMQAYISASI